MEWRAIPGYEGRYEVSDEGEIKSLARKVRSSQGATRTVSESIRKQIIDPDGYHHVMLSDGEKGKQTDFRVHRLVLMAFVGPCPEGCEGRHLDDKPSNNRLSNLEWGTKNENWKDRKRNRGHSGGNRSKLTAAQRIVICELWPRKTQREIAEFFEITEEYVQQLIRKKRNGIQIN